MKEEIKDLIEEIIKYTRSNVKELREEMALEESAKTVGILAGVYLALEENEKYDTKLKENVI